MKFSSKSSNNRCLYILLNKLTQYEHYTHMKHKLVLIIYLYVCKNSHWCMITIYNFYQQPRSQEDVCTVTFKCLCIQVESQTCTDILQLPWNLRSETLRQRNSDSPMLVRYTMKLFYSEHDLQWTLLYSRHHFLKPVSIFHRNLPLCSAHTRQRKSVSRINGINLGRSAEE